MTGFLPDSGFFCEKGRFSAVRILQTHAFAIIL